MEAQYRLLKPFYADDTYFEEGSIIEFAGIPNEQMEPLNDPARDKMKAFIESVEDGQRTAGRLSRKLEDIVEQEIKNRPRDVNQRVTMPSYKPDVPSMGNITPEGGPREPSKMLKTKIVSTPQTEPQKPIVIGAAKV